MDEETSVSNKQVDYDFQRCFVETETASEVKRSEGDEIDKFFSNFAREESEEISEPKPRLGWDEDFAFDMRQNFARFHAQ
jgi:hypothetical protein